MVLTAQPWKEFPLLSTECAKWCSKSEDPKNSAAYHFRYIQLKFMPTHWNSICFEKLRLVSRWFVLLWKTETCLSLVCFVLKNWDSPLIGPFCQERNFLSLWHRLKRVLIGIYANSDIVCQANRNYAKTVVNYVGKVGCLPALVKGASSFRKRERKLTFVSILVHLIPSKEERGQFCTKKGG